MTGTHEHPPRITRRQFLALGASVVAVSCSGDDSGSDAATNTTAGAMTGGPSTNAGAPTTTAPVAASTTVLATSAPPSTSAPADTLATDPFLAGVASGDPDGTSVVIWTRLLGAELPDEVTVSWELLDGDDVVASGAETATADTGHAVHAIVEIDRPLRYRFRAGGFASAAGRAAPAGGTAELRVAAATCQHYETGFYAAHRDIAEWQPDLVLHLGDFIYEGAANPIGGPVVRSHEGAEPTDLTGYRARYAHYLADPSLQAARAACPWLMIWDDHEVANNYAGLVPEGGDAAGFAGRRAQAYQAWWEHTPTRLSPPQGEERYDIYRGVEFGDLARISVLDGRQFRSDQACGNPVLSVDPPCDEVFADDLTMLGADQEAWLLDRFATSTARWNVVGQQTVMTDVTFNGSILNYDQWDGYPAARDRVLAAAPHDLVVITGDIHLAGVGTLGGNGVEFVTTAISSTANVQPELEDLVRSLPNILDADLVHRGYTRHTITPDRWTAEYRAVDDIASPDSSVSTWRTFAVKHGSGVAEPVA